MSFSALGLTSELVNTVEKLGYSQPSPIQQQAIPAVLEGKDVLAAAQTGTGKTAGFSLPILQRLAKGQSARNNQVRALILTPTRELAAQVQESIFQYGTELPLRSQVVFGGVKINPQMMKLRKGVDILVATPGRLIDLYSQNAIKFDALEVLVLDEADRMLDMGFIHDIKKILAVLPKKRQNLMFSATFSDDIRELAKSIVNKPVEISVSPPNSTAKTVAQCVHPVDKKQKSAVLAFLIQEENWQQVLVFTRTKHGANRLTRYLDERGINAAAIHGNKSQGARTRALQEFKSGKITVLVATDIAARGLDIEELPHVVNFDLPNVAEDYVHRIGRTGRAGSKGRAISLVSADEAPQLSDIENLIQKKIPREYISEFYPDHEVPETKLRVGPKKIKKPKKPKNKNETQSTKVGQPKKSTGKPVPKKKAASAKAKPSKNRPSKENAKQKPNSKSKPQSPWANKPGNKRRENPNRAK